MPWGKSDELPAVCWLLVRLMKGGGLLASSRLPLPGLPSKVASRDWPCKIGACRFPVCPVFLCWGAV